MRFMHSFSTRPLSIDLYGYGALRRMAGNIWYFSLSLAYLRRLGVETVLHTDTLGAALLGHLPYDEILLTLDNVPGDIHPRFWAAGKIWALAAEPAGTIHIDGDVFIKSDKALCRMESEPWDFLAQHYESSEWYEKENVVFDRDVEYIGSLGIRPHENGAYNTGIIAFGSQMLRDRFCHAYKLAAMHYSAVARDLLDSDNMLTPDVIIEQRHALQLCRGCGAKVALMLPEEKALTKQANAIGYQHVVTSRKFDDLDKCRAALQKIDTDIYNKTELLCRNILKK